MSNVILHPATISAINSEMAAYEARELRLLAEVAKLHGVISFMQAACGDALRDCMHPNSFQARVLRSAIERAGTIL